jgi:hypothetical protein
MSNQARDRVRRAKRKKAQRSAAKANMAPPALDAPMSLAQTAVHNMRLEGTLHELTGDGELDEQDLEAEWQHKLANTPSWQETIAGMADLQKRNNFLRHRRHAFVEGLHKAFARAQTKLEACADLEAHAGLEEQAKLEAQTELEEQATPKPDHLGDLAVALVEFQRHRLRELNGFQRELPQDLPRLQELPQVPETHVQQGLLPKEHEALALAMFQQNRVRRDNPDAPEAQSNQQLSKERYEKRALARITEERKHQSEAPLYTESQRRKKAARKIKLKAFDARRKKSNAKMEEFASKKQARKDSKEAAREQKREALEAEKQAKVNGPSQEELAQQRREAKKKRKRAALEANPNAKSEREQAVFGFRCFPTEKVRARAQKELLDIKVS